MVLFDQLRISDDGKYLFINAHVNTAKEFKDVYITKLTVMTSDKVKESTYIGSPTEDYIYQTTFDEGTREIALVLSANDCIRRWETDVQRMNFSQVEMSKTLFFVYIECTEATDECVPCFLKTPAIGVTFDENVLYQRVMNFTKELASNCTISQGFTDFILLWNAFKASVETEHFVPAIKFYEMLFGNNGTGTVNTKGCGCHG